MQLQLTAVLTNHRPSTAPRRHALKSLLSSTDAKSTRQTHCRKSWYSLAQLNSHAV